MNRNTVLYDVMAEAGVNTMSAKFSFDACRFSNNKERERDMVLRQLADMLSIDILRAIFDAGEEGKNLHQTGDTYTIYTMFCAKERLQDLLVRAYDIGVRSGLEHSMKLHAGSICP